LKKYLIAEGSSGSTDEPNSSTSLESRFVFIEGRLDINLKTSKLQIG